MAIKLKKTIIFILIKIKLYLLLKRIIYVFQLYKNLYNDGIKYIKYSKSDLFFKKNKYKIRYEILEKTHTIEKGLSSRKVQRDRGKENASSLFNIIKEYVYKYEIDEHSLYAIEVLSSYYNLNPNKTFEKFTNELGLNYNHLVEKKSGYKDIYKKDVLELNSGAFEDVIKLRASVRTFSTKEKINMSKVYKSIELANSSPSSCNRQATEVLVFENKATIMNLLTLQAGAETFKGEVPLLLLVTNDICGWDGVHERNQGLIDAGMFSMTLIHALTYNGLATCPLNLATTEIKEKGIRETLSLSDNFRLTMMIAVGNYEESYKIAKSKRIKVNA